MSYQVLARKWRPKSFQDMVGQQHIIKALTNALDNERLHHAYLFTGTRGVGKTTLARILAKCLNCESGVTSRPCGVCSNCTGIDEGRFVDLIEVDAASRAKVDETRDLMDNVQYAPSVGRYKVYLIDEVHMFSNHSFNALLKTLEEPPPHIKFLLATTESKKIPVTILSRCLQFNLKLLSVSQIEEQLLKIISQESIESDQNSIHLLAVAANGSLRDALSLLDQAISHGGGVLQEQQVRSMLGTIDNKDLKSLLSALIDGDARSVLQQVEAMAEHGPDYDAILVELLSSLQQIAIAQVLDESGGQTDFELSNLAGKISRENAQLFYQIGLMGRRDLALAPDPRSGFEMTLIRMLAFKPVEKVDFRKVSPDSAHNLPTTVEDKNKGETKNSENPEQDNIENEFASNDWQGIIDEMALAGLVKELAGHCILKEHTQDKIHLVLTPAQEHLLNTAQKERLIKALKTRFGNHIRIVITVDSQNEETPTQRRIREENELQEAAEKSVHEDSTVQALQDLFDATLDENSIRPNTN